MLPRVVLPINRLFELYERTAEHYLTTRTLSLKRRPLPLHELRVIFHQTSFIKEFYMQCYNTLLKTGKLKVGRISFTTELVDKVMKMHNQGHSAKEIAKRLRLEGWASREDKRDDVIRELIKEAETRRPGSGISRLAEYCNKTLASLLPL